MRNEIVELFTMRTNAIKRNDDDDDESNNASFVIMLTTCSRYFLVLRFLRHLKRDNWKIVLNMWGEYDKGEYDVIR